MPKGLRIKSTALVAAFCLGAVGCESSIDISVQSSGQAPGNLATPDDLLELFATRNVDAIVQRLNDLKQSTFQGQFHPVLEAIWREDRTAYPDIPWDVTSVPVVRLEIGDVLVQGHINGTTSDELPSIHRYALDQLESDDDDAVRAAILLVAAFNEASDVAVVEVLARDERYLRAVMVALNTMCIEEADAAAERTLASCATAYCDELVQSRSEMLAFKERTSWCSGQTDGLLQ